MFKIKKTRRVVGLSIVIALGGVSLTAVAGGFQLFESNVTNLGNAYAGVSAEAADASTEYFNPAGMTLLNNGEVTGSAIYINTNLYPNITNATTDISATTTNGITVKAPVVPVTGDQKIDTKAPFPIPAFHFVYPFHHKWALGFGANAPFGLQTKYDSTSSLVRFLATNSSVQVVDIGPSLAYQLTPEFSLGAGVSTQYMSATFDQSFPGLFGGTDGKFKNDGDNWGWGWHAGALYQFSPATRVGLAYHSKVNHTITGNSNVDINIPSTTLPVVNVTLPAVDFSVPGKFSANTTLPDYADLSLYHEFNSEWAVLGDIEFTHWKVFDVINANFTGDIADNGVANLTSAQLPFHFRNTWRLAGGINYKPWEKLTLRTGVAYDETPVSSAETRTVRIPDGDRFWIALGARYIINSAFTLDAGYTHLFLERFDINNTQRFDVQSPVNLPVVGPLNFALLETATGSYDGDANEVGLQLTWNIQSL